MWLIIYDYIKKTNHSKPHLLASALKWKEKKNLRDYIYI